MQITKAEAQVIHAKRRAFERYGVQLNRKTYHAMVRMIQSGKALFIRRRSNRVSLFYLVYQERAFKVVHDSKRHRIVTFLNDNL